MIKNATDICVSKRASEPEEGVVFLRKKGLREKQPKQTQERILAALLLSLVSSPLLKTTHDKTLVAIEISCIKMWRLSDAQNKTRGGTRGRSTEQDTRWVHEAGAGHDGVHRLHLDVALRRLLRPRVLPRAREFITAIRARQGGGAQAAHSCRGHSRAPPRRSAITPAYTTCHIKQQILVIRNRPLGPIPGLAGVISTAPH